MIARTLLRRAALIATLPLLVLASVGDTAAQDAATGLRIDSDKPVQIEGDNWKCWTTRASRSFPAMCVSPRTRPFCAPASSSSTMPADRTARSPPAARKIEKLEATGGVNIQSGTQVATGDAGTFDMGTEVLVLSGKRVTLSDGGNVATGCKLTVAMQSGRATLTGCGDSGSRPTILLQPQSVGGN
jgi:lipopolysaccharide export system protein LptA